MPSRDRPAFRRHATVNVRCPQCGKAMAEAFAEDNPDWFAHGRGAYGFVKSPARERPSMAEGADLYGVDNPRWRCQRCKAPHEVDNIDLYMQLRAAAAEGKRNITLGA